MWWKIRWYLSWPRRQYQAWQFGRNFPAGIQFAFEPPQGEGWQRVEATATGLHGLQMTASCWIKNTGEKQADLFSPQLVQGEIIDT